MFHLLTEAEFWVGVAFVIFIGVLVWAKVPGMAMKALDSRAELIRAELAEAERLRKEAEALLESIRAKREETEHMAAEMLANAEVEARRLICSSSRMCASLSSRRASTSALASISAAGERSAHPAGRADQAPGRTGPAQHRRGRGPGRSAGEGRRR